MSWQDVNQTSWSGFAQGDPLQAAIQQALQQHLQALAPVQDPWAPAQPETKPSSDNPRDTPDWLSSGGGHDGTNAGTLSGGFGLGRSIDNQSGYNRDPSMAALQASIGNAVGVTNPAKTAIMTGVDAVTRALTGTDLGLGADFGSYGNMSTAALDARARTLGYNSFADVVAEKARMGSLSPANAAANALSGPLGGGANAAIGRATASEKNPTSARDRAYGPGFGPGPGASTAASSRSRSPAPGGSVGAALGTSRF